MLLCCLGTAVRYLWAPAQLNWINHGLQGEGRLPIDTENFNMTQAKVHIVLGFLAEVLLRFCPETQLAASP